MCTLLMKKRDSGCDTNQRHLCEQKAFMSPIAIWETQSQVVKQTTL